MSSRLRHLDASRTRTWDANEQRTGIAPDVRANLHADGLAATAQLVDRCGLVRRFTY